MKVIQCKVLARENFGGKLKLISYFYLSKFIVVTFIATNFSKFSSPKFASHICVDKYND